MSTQQEKVFAGGIWTGSEGRVHCCFPCNSLLSTAQNHCVTQYFVGQRLEAPLGLSAAGLHVQESGYLEYRDDGSTFISFDT